MPYTEMGNMTRTKLALITQRARRDPSFQFVSLAHLLQIMRERFAKFGLELHPGKTRTFSFGRFELINAKREGRKSNTFDFLGLTHYCTTSRKGGFLLGRKTSAKRFRRSCQALSKWLRGVRNAQKVQQWWPILQSKLVGHYRYYGVSGNMRSLSQYEYQATRLAFKWINRRSQRRSYDWDRFRTYLNRYPLPKPRIVCGFYGPSPVKV